MDLLIAKPRNWFWFFGRTEDIHSEPAVPSKHHASVLIDTDILYILKKDNSLNYFSSLESSLHHNSERRKYVSSHICPNAVISAFV
jgi:hypothetical protein